MEVKRNSEEARNFRQKKLRRSSFESSLLTLTEHCLKNSEETETVTLPNGHPDETAASEEETSFETVTRGRWLRANAGGRALAHESGSPLSDIVSRVHKQ
ncbi:hypothetical protein EVAR_36100_1 [Eumeta japonica]|uniref:Uncharacterized protein n=1 Tax=Eumeta variegata TaxID=151549 RepID=A0A4C1YIX1_EUMVA|nr:hypothetical protein EVAR_36100_1 [Eumeta japonica]